MAVTTDRSGPYTSPKVIIDLVERHRERGIPSPVDADTLARAGVSESLIPRTLQSLQALDLIEENGSLTDTLEAIRLSPQAEYQQRLKEWLDAAYADVLQFVDPATDDDTKVRDAFRNFKPVGQQDRMVTLFLRLYEYAGVELPSGPKPAARSRPKAERVQPQVRARVRPGVQPAARPQQPATKGLPAAIAGLLESLPAEGDGWTQARRDGFHATFGAVLDFCFPIVATAPSEASENDGLAK